MSHPERPLKKLLTGELTITVRARKYHVHIRLALAVPVMIIAYLLASRI